MTDPNRLETTDYLGRLSRWLGCQLLHRILRSGVPHGAYLALAGVGRRTGADDVERVEGQTDTTGGRAPREGAPQTRGCTVEPRHAVSCLRGEMGVRSNDVSLFELPVSDIPHIELDKMFSICMIRTKGRTSLTSLSSALGRPVRTRTMPRTPKVGSIFVARNAGVGRGRACPPLSARVFSDYDFPPSLAHRWKKPQLYERVCKPTPMTPQTRCSAARFSLLT
jgi:hypothetical protein